MPAGEVEKALVIVVVAFGVPALIGVVIAVASVVELVWAIRAQTASRRLR